MDLKINRYIVYSVILVLVLLVAFNFEELTGYASKDIPTSITITNTLPGGDILNDRTTARLRIDNSFPNQRIRVYDEGGRYAGYTINTENCKVSSTASSEYNCDADLYVSTYELEDGKRYYFQALNRKGNLDGGKAFFTFKN